MPRRRKTEVYVANETFWTEDRELIRKGQTRVRAGHELLKRYGDLFDPIEDHIDFDVEQTTAAPGERRKVSLNTGGNDGAER